MKKKAISGIILTFFLIATLTFAFNIQPVRAADFITIKSDGSIDPPGALISSTDNITYTITSNINKRIVVERSNIIIDGVKHVVQGNGTGRGFSLQSISNVTIKNTNIEGFDFGVYFTSSSNNEISLNNMTNNDYGVAFFYSSNNKVFENSIANNDYGIYLSGSSGNNISVNNVTGNNDYGIYLFKSSNNTLSGNVMNGNTYNFYVKGVELSHFIQTINVSNLVDGKRVYYLVNQSDLSVSPSTHPQAGFLGLVNCGNVTVEGLTLAYNRQGLLLAYSNNSRITNSNVSNNDYGLWLFSSFNNTLSSNNITNNNYGVWLNSSSNSNRITGNNITENNYYGTYLLGSLNNNISANIVANNNDGIWLSSSPNNTLFGNNITNNQVGIEIESSNNNNMSGNSITNNNIGIELDSSSSNSISGNNITNINGGVGFFSSFTNTMFGNNITNNGIGLYFDNSSNNNILENNITNNQVGIEIESSNNKFFHNNFIDNILQVDIHTTGYTNSWDDGYPSGGNYWSNYTGVDADGDGIGDTPHEIDTNNIDNYPLMSPYIRIPGDKTPPIVFIISPENKTYSARSIPLNFTLSEPTSWIGYSLNGQMNITISGNTTLIGLSDGVHTITVYANDTAGNMGSSNTVYFTIDTHAVDTTPPSISILSPENKTYTTTDIPLNFTVNESVSWTAYSLNGQANVTISGNTTLYGLPQGSHILTVYANDTAGNTGAETVYFTIQTPSELFPLTWIALAIVIIAIGGAGLLLYFIKFKKT